MFVCEFRWCFFHQSSKNNLGLYCKIKTTAKQLIDSHQVWDLDVIKNANMDYIIGFGILRERDRAKMRDVTVNSLITPIHREQIALGFSKRKDDNNCFWQF